MVEEEEVLRGGMLRIAAGGGMVVADIDAAGFVDAGGVAAADAAGTDIEDIEAHSGSEVVHVRNFEVDGLDKFGFENNFDTFGFEDDHDTFDLEEDSQS